MEGVRMNTRYMFRHNAGAEQSVCVWGGGDLEEVSWPCRARERVALNFKLPVYTQTTDNPAEGAATAK